MADNTLQNEMPPAIPSRGGRSKFIVGGLILLAAVAYLIVSNIAGQGEYFMTVDELTAREGELVGRSIRVSGAVIGETISFDGQTLSFDIVHIPDSAADLAEDGGLAEVLHQAIQNPNSSRVTVILYDEPMPDLLQHEAQAIVTGTIGDDGIFYADELLLKCPTRYEEAVPDQTGG